MRHQKQPSVKEVERNIQQLIAEYKNRLLTLRQQQQKIIKPNNGK